MAAIDKIYIDSFEKYKRFKEWCLTQPKIKDKYGKETSLINYVFSYNEWKKLVFIIYTSTRSNEDSLSDFFHKGGR